MGSVGGGRRRTAVVALGGNAIIRQGESGDIHDQFRHTRETLDIIFELVRRDYNLVITHGNGPQIGNKLIQVESALDQVPDTPLGVLVAGTEGEMGYMIEQSFQNLLQRRGIGRRVYTLLTQVVVDPADPALRMPLKPIGPFYPAAKARELIARNRWSMVEDAGRGWRRAVCSPRPVEIVQVDVIREMAARGDIIIACGGGGIPVTVEPDGSYEGVDAVIDKDLASSLLGRSIGADLLMILTFVDHICLDFGRPAERRLKTATLCEMRRYLAEGHFPPGSMGPKVQAAIDFLEGSAPGEREVIITSPEMTAHAEAGDIGTRIVPDP